MSVTPSGIAHDVQVSATGKYTTCHSTNSRQVQCSGNMTKESFSGVAGKPTLGVEGYAEVHLAYDEDGNTTGATFFGVDGKPSLCEEGCAQDNWGMNAFATAHWEYDEYGNLTKEEYFGVDGEPLSP